jgi:signal transduction histidine kinase
VAAEITVEVTDETVAVSVRDEGPGMDAETASQVFDAFYRAEGSRNRDRGGSGLGLAIAAGLTTALSGRLDLETSPGEGTTFVVVLPRVPGGGEPVDESQQLG